MLLGIAVLAAQALFHSDSNLDDIVSSVANQTKAEFRDLSDDQFAITIARIDRKAKESHFGHIRGSVSFYPASTVKLFYLSYAAHLIQHKKLVVTPEFQRGITDMIVDSSNDATALVLDTVTGTTGGPELPDKEFKSWQEKRNAVNRWAKEMGLEGINVNQKTWNEGPYGRERQSLGPKYENRNALTSDASAKFMSLIALDQIADADRMEWMKKPLLRAIPADSDVADFQSKAFTGQVLPKGTILHSKAGYTDTVRHDIAWFKLPNDHEYVFAIFTKGKSNEPKLIPFIAKSLLTALGEATI